MHTCNNCGSPFKGFPYTLTWNRVVHFFCTASCKLRFRRAVLESTELR